MKKIFLLVALAALPLFSQEQIIPKPVETAIAETRNSKPVILDSSTRIECSDKDPAFRQKVMLARQFLSKGTGLNFSPRDKPGLVISFSKDNGLTQYGPETYKIQASPARINITSSTEKGAYYAVQSLAQMLPPEFFSSAGDKSEIEWKLADRPFTVLDYPRFSWRAFMLDEARYFFGMDVCKQMIDQMALLKFNVFHWHLTDDVGWRIEIKKYPKLTQVGGKRNDTEIGTWDSGQYAGKPHEGFYTQEQIREIIRYAAERNITVIPEIDMPGHAAAAIVSYPELKLSLRPLTEIPLSFTKGAVFDPTSEKTYAFLEDIITEVAALFPSKIIHIGGDEVRYKECWEGEPAIQDLMKKKKLNSLTDVQMYFTNRISAIIAKKGCRMMGWSEIMGHDIHGDGGGPPAAGKLDKNAIIHFWYGKPELAKTAASEGHDVVNSTSFMTYYSQDYNRIPLSKAYSFDPLFQGIPKKDEKKILGGGCQLWTEWIPDFKHLQYQAFPRMIAFAETVWTKKENKNYGNFKKRLDNYIAILKNLDYDHGPID